MMKRRTILNKSISLLLALMLVFSFAPAALAADDSTAEPDTSSSVTYVGGAEKFVFLPGSEYTDSDLFNNFKGVMPGDKLSQKVKVKNTCGKAVNIYMRAVVHDEKTNPLSKNVSAKVAEQNADKTLTEQERIDIMKDFLQQLTMTVKQGDKELFHATAEQLGGLEKNVPLGRLQSGQGTELDVVLEVPIEMGNEYANRIGEVDWVFTVEEIEEGGPGPGPGPDPDKPEPPIDIPDPDVPKVDPPVEPEKPDVNPDIPVIDIPGEPVPEGDKPALPGDAPKTGDTARILLWVVVLLMAGTGLAAVRKKN